MHIRGSNTGIILVVFRACTERHFLLGNDELYTIWQTRHLCQSKQRSRKAYRAVPCRAVPYPETVGNQMRLKRDVCKGRFLIAFQTEKMVKAGPDYGSCLVLIFNQLVLEDAPNKFKQPSLKTNQSHRTY